MKIGIIYDTPNWAQHHHALGLQKHAGPGFDVEIRSLGEISDEWIKSVNVIYCIYVASAAREFFGVRTATCLASHAWMHPQYDETNWRTKGTNKTRCLKHGANTVAQVQAVVCRNTTLARWARNYNPNSRYIPAGVDLSIFHPSVKRPENVKLRVGWCGQVGNHQGDFKGYAEVWHPLKAWLADRYEFVEHTHDVSRALGQQQMADWYRSLDVFVCTSCADGTPNVVFEAAACGCAVISTDVGQVSDWSALRGLGCIVSDYGNEAEAEEVIGEIAVALEDMEDESTRWSIGDQLADSIRSEYSYELLAPRTLKFIGGVE